MKTRTILALTAGLLLAARVPASAALTYSEAVSGDLTGSLSNNSLSGATFLDFAPGRNVVTGTMGGDPGEGIPLDRDVFTFTLQPDERLTAINVLQYGHSGQSFYAIAGGTSISIIDPANHLSNILVTGTGDLLPGLDAGAYQGGLGLTAPLEPGTYTVWFQEVAAVVPYSIAYTVVSAVPEPGSVVWGGIMGLVASVRRPRRRRAV